MVQLINPLQAVNEGQQFVDGLFTQRANQQAGQALQQGNYNQAAGALFGNGDLRGGMGVQQYGQEQQAAQQAQTAAQKAQQLQATLQIVGTVKRARDQGQDVSQILPQYRDAFIAMGTDPQQLAQIEQQVAENPAFLDQIEQIVGQQARELTFQKAGDNLLVFEPGNPDPVRSFNAPKKPIELNGVLVDPDTYEPILDTRQPEYIQRDPTKELIEVTPGGGSQALAERRSGTRGQRNNNPGNIEDGAFARSLPGYAGSDGRFAIFDSPQAGTQAGAELLNRYAARGVVTPAQVINRWAPPSDNNPTQAYAAYVANRLGIGVNDPIPANRRAEAFQAINEFENGGQRPSSGPSRSGGPRVVSGAMQAGTNVSILSNEEKTSLGLPQNSVYQRDQQGRITQVAGSGSRDTNLNQTDQRRLSASVTAAESASSLANDARRFVELNRRAPTNPLVGATGPVAGLNPTYAEMRSIQSRMAPLMREAGSGAMSDRDVALFLRAIPSVGNPTETNIALAGVIQAGAQRSQDRAAFLEDYAQKNGNLLGAQEQWTRYVRANPLFEERGGNTAAKPNVPSWRDFFSGSSGNQPQRQRSGNTPGVRFDLTPAQQQARQRVIGSGGRPSERLGSTRNPYYINPADVTASFANVPRGGYFITPDGQVRGPKP